MRIAAAVAVLALVVGQVGAQERGAGSIPESGIEPGAVEQVRIEGQGMGVAVGSFTIPGRGARAPVVLYKVGEVKSNAATLDEAAVEIGAALHTVTAKNSSENCATICKAKAPGATPWVATLITAGSHAFCPVVANMCPDGYEAASDIHSHIHTRTYTPNEVDRQVLGGAPARVDADRFSVGDIQGKAGYLVGRTLIRVNDGGQGRVVYRF